MELFHVGKFGIFGSKDPTLFDGLGPCFGLVQPIPADMRLLFSKGIPYFLFCRNLDSVNHCTSKEISMEIKRYTRARGLIEPVSIT